MITAEEAIEIAKTTGADNKLETVLCRISESANHGDSEIVFGDKFISAVVEEKLQALGYKIKREHPTVCVSW